MYANERGELKEEVPTNLPTSLGKGFVMRVFIDSDHAGDQVTRRLQTEFLVYLNNTLIYWTSKKQTTVKTSLFGSEFMAIKHAMEYIRGLRYKLRAMGVLVVGCAYIYGDNKSVLVNSGTLHSQLKKSNSVAFHHVCEGSTLDEWRTTYINAYVNVADLLTKNLPSGAKRTKFCQTLFHFLKPNLDVGKEADHHVAAAAMMVLPGSWIEAFVGAVEVYENQTAAQA